jgi:hypothetical protein
MEERMDLAPFGMIDREEWGWGKIYIYIYII